MSSSEEVSSSHTSDMEEETACASKSHSDNSMISKQVGETATSADVAKPGTSTAQETGTVQNGMDALLQRHRNEIMFELRRLTHGERPVTGQGNRQALENFFQHSTLNAATSEGTAPSAEERGIRPETVVVEVQSLVERRPVSSLLESSQFRRRLENTIRNSLSGSAPAPPRSVRQSRVGLRQTLLSEISARRPTVAPSESSSSSVEVQDIPEVHAPVQDNHTEAWVQQQPAADPPLLQVQDIEEAQREALVYEISELVHRQLVTSALEGDSRARLESHMQRRIAQSGRDGSRAIQALQSLPRGRVQRNDFSHLGIQPGQADNLSENLDNMSIVSATAAVHVPYAQSNAALSNEICSLKTQMQELKHMMKLSFDLQMDIQRSVHQEVAAAMNNQNQIHGAASCSSRAPSQPVSGTHCLICLDKSADSVLYQCGHICVCFGCGMELKAREAHCPVCRAPIRDIIRAYKC